MPNLRYYTPRLDRDVVSALYHAAKSRRIPMTRLASALVRDGLAQMEGSHETTAVVREEPPAADPGEGPH